MRIFGSKICDVINKYEELKSEPSQFLGCKGSPNIAVAVFGLPLHPRIYILEYIYNTAGVNKL
jgi:hypothetical protein